MTTFTISSGATSKVTVGAGDTLTVDAGGTSSKSFINGGVEVVSGTAISDFVRAGASVTIASGGVASGENMEGGTVTVEAGGQLLGGATINTILVDAGSASGVSTNKRTYVQRGGVFQDGVVGRGVLYVQGGGVASGTTAFGTASGSKQAIVEVKAFGRTVDDIGSEIVSAHGAAYRTHATNQTVLSGGLAVGTVVSGVMSAAAGSVARKVTVQTGSAVIDGSLSGATVSGGTLIVNADAEFSGPLRIVGGTTVFSGGVGSGTKVNLIGNGTLALADVSEFHATIAGMHTASEKLDLLGFGFNSSETVSWTRTFGGGMLTITDGAQVATLNLTGFHTSQSFHLSDDGHGGTIVVDPAATHFTQAAAGLAHNPGAPMVHDGGVALIGPSATFATATSGRA